jgi:acyl-CoA synthetase (AMP-forming)/AMP-acid ligase II
VLECAVVAAPDPTWGEVPAAFVVLKPGAAADEAEIVAYCRGRLAAFKVPKRVAFIAQIPKGGTGKALKAQLREPMWRGQARRVS